VLVRPGDRGVGRREEGRQGRPRSLEVAARDACCGLEALERGGDEGLVAVDERMRRALALRLLGVGSVVLACHLGKRRVVCEEGVDLQEPGRLETERRAVARPAPLAGVLAEARPDRVPDDVARACEQVLVGLHEPRAVAGLARDG